MPNINKTKYALLGVLSMKPASGYDIKKFCDKSISHFWNENYGHIYPVLKDMENSGLVAGQKTGSDGAPPRTVYSITAKGEAELADWLALPVEPSPTRNELLLKLLFSTGIPVANTLEKLDSTLHTHQIHLEEYRRIEAEYASNPALLDSPGYQYWISALRYGMMDAEFRIRWCKETMDRLRENENRHSKMNGRP
jgi:PadR family transcriptional regulator, regulatory protein AphA